MIDPATLIYQVTTIDRALPKGRAAEYLIPYHGKGEANGRAVLTVQQVRRIRARPPLSRKYCEKAVVLARELGVSEKLISLIRRGIELWTNHGDVVLTPFGGIGSEPFVALQMGRKAVAVELKDSYFNQLVRNVENATRQTAGLFSEPAA